MILESGYFLKKNVVKAKFIFISKKNEMNLTFTDLKKKKNQAKYGPINPT